MEKTLLVVLGPTAVGKTSVALRLAKALGVPIVSADSRQMFAEIPIGTAAPTAAELREVKHFFVGNLQLDDYYSASIYEQDVLQLLQNELFKHGDLALMSGGSMMYIDAVCQGIDDIPTVDDDTRATMKRRLKEEGLEALVAELHELDPEHWAIVDRQNPRRVVHALEICHMTGRTYTSFRKNSAKKRPFRIVKIGLNRPREELYDRINRRTLQMIDDGFIDEARRVYPQRELNSLHTVGFREMFDHLDGLVTIDQTIAKIQSATRRYARKQLTWFKRDESIRWFSPSDYDHIIKYITQSLA